MNRIGLVGGPLNPLEGNFTNPDGSVRVLKEKCHSCPYRPDSGFNPQLKRIHKTCEKNSIFNYCHSTYPSDVLDAICRGSYDAFESRAKDMQIDFVSEPKSMYIVLPASDS